MEFSLGIAFLFIVLLAPTLGQDMVGDRKVRVFLENKNFQSALDNCKENGMELLSLYNKEEELQAVALARKYRIMEFWLGATDIGHESTFTSSKTGKKLTYSNWAGLEPNNGGLLGDLLGGRFAENCVNIWIPDSHRHEWNDHKCRKRMKYICETRDDD